MESYVTTGTVCTLYVMQSKGKELGKTEEPAEVCHALLVECPG